MTINQAQRYALFREYIHYLYTDCMGIPDPTPEETETLFLNYTTDDHHTLWIDIYPSESDLSNPIGFLIIGFPPNCHPDAAYYIQEAYIHPNYQGRGYMRAALNSFLKSHPGTYCLFVVQGNERAYTFWEYVFLRNHYVPCYLRDVGAGDEYCTQYGFRPQQGN